MKKCLHIIILLSFICIFVQANGVCAEKYYKCTHSVPANNIQNGKTTTYVWSAKIVEGTESDCRKMYSCVSDTKTCKKLKPLYEQAYQACMINRKMAREAVQAGNCKVFYK